MKVFDVAIDLEASIRKEFEYMHDSALVELAPLLNFMIILQTRLENLLHKARNVDPDSSNYPEFDESELLGSEQEWRTVTKNLAPTSKGEQHLIHLWMIYAVVEKSSQYYQQATANSAYPATKLFCSSLFQIKTRQRRHIGGVIRGIYNDIWSKVGFAPFILGKD